MPVKKAKAKIKAKSKSKKATKKKNHKYTYDIISVGDATLDTFLKVDDASVLCNVNKNTCWLCLNYADKIPVKELNHSIGGNASNNVVGSAMLGMKAAIYSELGDDETAKKIRNNFSKLKIDTKYVKTQKKTKTNYSVVIKHQSERTILTYHDKRSYKLPKLSSSRYMYLTSMGEGCDKIYKDIIAYTKKYDVKLCFGPGTYQRKAGLKKIKSLLKYVTVWISNKEEAQEMFGYPQTKDIKEKDYLKLLMHKVHIAGPDIVIVTDSRRGSYLFDGEKNYHLGIVEEVMAIYPTGAGDAFSTGFIAALSYGKEPKEALRWATFNSTGVIQEMGPHNGLLNKKRMLEFSAKYKSLIAKEI